jgi:hypothetical protein
VRAMAQQTYCCRAEAEAAAQKLRTLPSAYHQGDVGVEECPQYGPGRPRRHQPRPSKAMSYRLQATLRAQPAVIMRQRQEAAGFVLLTTVPTQGEMAHSAGAVLRAYKEQHGVEHNCAFLQDPVLVNSLCLKKPERLAALGLVLLLALRLWRLVERARRVHVETPGSTWTGWDKQETQKPTAFMLMTKFAGVIGLKVGTQRQLARPLSALQQQYLAALGIAPACCTASPGGEEASEGHWTSHPLRHGLGSGWRASASGPESCQGGGPRRWCISSQGPQALSGIAVTPWRSGGMVIGLSSERHAASQDLTLRGQHEVAEVAGSGAEGRKATETMGCMT